ncbi:MAG: hypothetical protein FWB76_02610 [Oscillospiraceae bacterium]|nr:hypothetical protein [Oscillospiraceae bacterium]
MDARVFLVVGLFMFACVAMMVFNFIIIRRIREKNTFSAGRHKTWWHILAWQALTATDKKPPCPRKHNKFLLKKLGDAEQLVAYGHALKQLKDEHPSAYLEYMQHRHEVFHQLGQAYARKACVERACFADFVCEFPQVTDGVYETLVSTLVRYINDENVHCRTNALRALSSVGNVQGVANALLLINDKTLFVHHQLLTDALLNFSGNKEALSEQLWRENWRWNDNVRACVKQFMAVASTTTRSKPVPQGASAAQGEAAKRKAKQKIA